MRPVSLGQSAAGLSRASHPEAPRYVTDFLNNDPRLWRGLSEGALSLIGHRLGDWLPNCFLGVRVIRLQ